MTDFTLIDAKIPASNGCNVLTKTRAYVSDQGVAATLRWYLLDRNGNAVDFTSLYGGGSVDAAVSVDAADLLDDPTVMAAFHELVISECDPPITRQATIVDALTGEVKVAIPGGVFTKPGIYQVHWSLKDADGNNVLINKTLLSIEPTLFRADADARPAMTFEQIRSYLQDYPEENLLLGDVEFDETDIAQAVVRPIREWNETTPQLIRYDTNTFPWVHNWTQATVGYLLRSAALRFERNNLPIAASGVQVNDQDKATPYMKLAELHMEEWKTFMRRKKIEINIDRGYGGNVASVYGAW